MKFTLITFTLFTAFSINAETQKSINVAMSDVKPVSFRENGALKGINYDILRQIESNTGEIFNYNLYPHSRILNSLPEVNPDLVVVFQNVCKKYEKQYEIASHLYVSMPTIFVKKGTDTKKELRIGRILGTCSVLMNAHVKKDNQFDVSTLDQAIEMLNKNRLDGICGVSFVLNYSKQNVQLKNELVVYKSDNNKKDFTAVICQKKSLPVSIKNKIKSAAKKIKLPSGI